MQERSDLWKSLAASTSSHLETAAEINGVTYTSISAPVITRVLAADALSVGNCTSAALQLSILTTDTIPYSAEVVIKKRLAEGDQVSEWLPAGTFFISKRQTDKVTKQLISLICYDAMRKAEDPYPLYAGYETDWPKPMAEVISEIAEKIGVEVDSRTWAHIRDGSDYVVPYPLGLKMKKVLGYIAAVHGGNFYITQDDRLRFVPMRSASDAGSAEDRLDIVAITGKINTGERCTISGVSIPGQNETFTAGDLTGCVLSIPRTPYATQQIADDLFSAFGGMVYAPFTIERGLYDPAAELGDFVVSRDDVRSVLYTETARMNLAYRADISAPFKAELDDEYPYKSKTDELDEELQELVTVVADKASIDDLYALRAQIDNLSVSDIKTGIIHSNDYEYEPYPRVYPSDGTYPANTLYPSNGEYVLRGFAIDFGTGVIYGAFYSEQIIALQEIAAAQTARLAALSEELDDIQTRLTSIGQNDQQQDTAISGLQILTASQGSTISGHTSDISALQGTVSSQGGTISQHTEQIGTLRSDISDLTSQISGLDTDLQDAVRGLTAAIEAVKNSLTYPKSPITQGG